MTIYSPNFLSPNNVGINPSADNTFSWNFNGGTQTAYQVLIYKISDNSLEYDSTKSTSSNEYHSVPSGSLTGNTLYKWKVRVWENTDSADSQYTVVKTNAVPTIVLETITSPEQNYTFQATYTHTDSIFLKTYEFILYDNSDVVVDRSGVIYSATPTGTILEYEFKGLVNGITYKVECNIVDQNDVFATSGKESFTSSYTYPDSVNSLLLENLENLASIKLSWANIIQVTPTTSDDEGVAYDYVAGKFNQGVEIYDGHNITYLKNIPLEFSLVFYIKLDGAFIGQFLQIGTDYKLSYDGTRFIFENQDRITGSKPVDVSTELTDWFLVYCNQDTVVIINDDNSVREIIK